MADDRNVQTNAETERRFVRSEDPALTPEANRLLTDELREVVGRDKVEVPRDTPRRAQEAHATHSPLVATLVSNRPLIIVTLLAALVVGGIVSIATGWYVAVLLAVGLHALATLLVAAGAIQLTTQVEHVAPETAARLEQEGVADPDRVLSQLVEDFAGATQAGGVPEVLGSGSNERTTTAEDDPARDMLEQRTALTPQSRPGPSAGEGSAIALLPWWVVVGVMVVSVVAVPFFAQGWLVPLILIPIGLAWMALQRWMAHADRARSDRPLGDTADARRRLLPIAVFVVAGAVWFMLVMQLVTGYA
jgi:fatty acid desaturase